MDIVDRKYVVIDLDGLTIINPNTLILDMGYLLIINHYIIVVIILHKVVTKPLFL